MSFIYKNAFNLRYLKKLESNFEKIDDESIIKKELSYLARILYKEEKVIAFLSGLMNNIDCLIVLTDKRMILLDTTLIFTIINLDEIDLIRDEIIDSFGEIFIKFNTKERLIKNISKSTVKLFINLVIDSIEKYKENNFNETIQKDTEENYSLKFVELKGQGIILEDKFDGIKQKLINGII